MTTLQMARDQWSQFFDRVSRLHADEPVRVEVLRLDLGAQVEVSGLPFDGISADLKDGENSITIAAGSALDDHVAHLIADPLEVRVLRGPSDDEEVIEIRAADQTTTLLYFDAPRGWSAPAAPGPIPGARGLTAMPGTGAAVASRAGGTMSTVTRADVEELIGDASDHLIARIIATGATREEVAEAALEIEVGTGEKREVDTGRVNELCEILREELDEDIWKEG